jgi:RNA polymerase sigma-70 factor (ECF subfamily)
MEDFADRLSGDSAKGVSVGGISRPDEIMEGVQLERLVKLAIAQVDPDFREVLILRDVEDLTYEEIAAITNLPDGTVKSRIHRGRAQLRALVEKATGEKVRSDK